MTILLSSNRYYKNLNTFIVFYCSLVFVYNISAHLLVIDTDQK